MLRPGLRSASAVLRLCCAAAASALTWREELEAEEDLAILDVCVDLVNNLHLELAVHLCTHTQGQVPIQPGYAAAAAVLLAGD